MTPSAKIEMFHRVIQEGFNRGNFDAWNDCFPENIAEHQYGMPQTLEGFKRAIAGLRTAFPDLTLTIEDTACVEDKVWSRMTGRGTHRAPFLGMQPTGKSFEITVIDVCRFENGKIVEHWGVPDRFALLDQLGGLPFRRPGA
jgi:predicted ester cyclase